MAEHEAVCDFSYMICPLRRNCCDWFGKRSQVLQHLRANHAANIYLSVPQKLQISRFSVDKIDRKYYVIFHTFNNFFRCTLELTQETGVVKIGVFQLEPVFQKSEFRFEVIIHKGKKEYLNKSRIARCLTEDDSCMFFKPEYVTYEYEMVKRYCDKDGRLVYSINIILESSKYLMSP